MAKHIFDELKKLNTEKQNQKTKDIDTFSALQIVEAINSEDRSCAERVYTHRKEIAHAIDFIHKQLKNGGRLIYIGAGTSGRLGVLDASECPPTYGTKPEQIVGVIAGGYEALVKSKEGSEDQYEQGWKDLKKLTPTQKDVIFGIMASGRTPYVIGALKEAKKNKIPTILLSCNAPHTLKLQTDILICIDSGAEVIMGSTRMKAGTIQKMVLNMITTGTMVLLGKTYHNVMIDIQQNSKKLVERSKNIIMMLGNTDYDEASQLLNNARGSIKKALIMKLKKISYEDATKELKKYNGHIKNILDSK